MANTRSTKATRPVPRTRTRQTRRSRRSTRAAAPRATADIVSQVQAARRQPWAAALAGLVGGLPPFLGQAIAHAEVGAGGVAWWRDPHALVVAGCMLFSMSTVYLFGRATFGDAKKAIGFVAAMELAMIASGLWYVRLVTLATVVAVNVIMTGSGIALAYEAAQRRRDADGRRSRTRAEASSAGRPVPPADHPAARPVPHPAAWSASWSTPPAGPSVALVSRACVPDRSPRRSVIDAIARESARPS